jgi:hypothetical protein
MQNYQKIYTSLIVKEKIILAYTNSEKTKEKAITMNEIG